MKYAITVHRLDELPEFTSRSTGTLLLARIIDINFSEPCSLSEQLRRALSAAYNGHIAAMGDEQPDPDDKRSP